MKKIKEITIEDLLRDEVKQLKKEAKPYLAYKKLILTAANSKYEAKDVVAGIKFVAKLIDKKDWHMVEKVGGTSGDLMARGVCDKCDINLVGDNPKPRDFTLPCLIKGCIFNKPTNTKVIQ